MEGEEHALQGKHGAFEVPVFRAVTFGYYPVGNWVNGFKREVECYLLSTWGRIEA